MSHLFPLTQAGVAAVFGKSGVDCKTTGTTAMNTDRPATRAIPIAVMIDLETVSGFLTPATISIGTNSPTYNNIATAVALTGLDTLSKGFVLAVISPITPAVLPGDDLRCNITIAATGTTVLAGVWIVGALR